jgi:hypothetical protein
MLDGQIRICQQKLNSSSPRAVVSPKPNTHGAMSGFDVCSEGIGLSVCKMQIRGPMYSKGTFAATKSTEYLHRGSNLSLCRVLIGGIWLQVR